MERYATVVLLLAAAYLAVAGTSGLLISVLLGASILLVLRDRARTEALVTAQARELDQARAELDNYKLIVNSTPVAISAKEYSAAHKGVYFLINPKAAELRGGTLRAGCSDHDWLPAEAVETLHARDQQILAGRAPVIVEERVTNVHTGMPAWYLSTKVPLLDSNGNPYALAAIALDVTEQKLLTDHLAALVDAIPDLIFRLSGSGVYLDYKNSRGQWLLSDVDQLIGTNLRDDPLPHDVQQRYMTAIGEAILTGAVQAFEYSLEAPQGMLHYDARVVKSGPDEVVALVRDITEGRRIRAALEQANIMLRAANEELREFASVASHDLQEPLRTVHGFAGLLEKRYGDAFDDRGRQWLERIMSGTQRMRNLIDDLLAYSRVGWAGTHEPVDVAALVDEILADARASIEDAGAVIEVEALPTITANRTELRQVFLNLISNGLKFRRLDVTPRLAIMAEPVPDGWAFLISDNGIGIDAAHHARIFQIFQRLHGRAEYPGTGIGLSLVKKIVERQGGEVSVSSTLGQGTVFRLVLPARPRLSGMIADAADGDMDGAG